MRGDGLFFCKEYHHAKTGQDAGVTFTQNFCPMKSRLTFNGMNRYAPPAVTQPGDCSSIVNLRRQSNHLIPVGTPEHLYYISEKDHRIFHIHTCYDGEHHIAANDYGVYDEALIPKDNKIDQRGKLLFVLEGDPVLSMQSIGNTLIVVCSKHTYYLLYKEGEYIFLGEKPDFPEISFSHYIRYTDSCWVPERTFEEPYYNPTRLETEETNFYNGAYYDAFFQLQEKAWKRHYFIQPILIRYALTLYDGSRIFSSAPVMLSLPNPIQPYQLKIRMKNSNDICSGSYAGEILAENYCIMYMIHSLNLENWKDIVKSIDFFVAPEATIFEPDQTQHSLDFNIERTESQGNVTFYIKGAISFLDMNEIKNRYLQSSLFYKIASFEEWRDLKVGEWQELKNEIRPDLLVHEEALSPDNTTLLSTGAQVSYVYNRQLHLANLSKRLFAGFPLSLYHTGREDAVLVEAYVCTYLKTERGESRVVWSGKVENFNNQLSPLLSYPDSSAYMMEIVVNYNSRLYKKNFPLVPSKYENRADYLDSSLTYIALDGSGPSPSVWDDYVPTASNDDYTQENIVRVSKPDNPFVFPAEQVYSVSNSPITGIGSITTALSEGQFGEFPLYMFTEEGIWALQNGSGDVCYSNLHQLSREPILKGCPIIPLEESIAFATPKGLSLLQGITVQQILSFDEIPYEKNQLVVTSHGLDSDMHQAVYDPTPLSKCIQTCHIAYNPLEKELLFCAPELGYTIVLHLPSLYMFRTTQYYSSFLCDSTHLLGQNDKGQVLDLQNEEQNGPMPIAILTRPFTLQSEAYQKLRYLSLRASSSGEKVILSVWGGNNAEADFALVGRLSLAGKIPGQLALHMTGPAYKYFRIFLSGEVTPDFHLWAVDLLADLIDHDYRLR